MNYAIILAAGNGSRTQNKKIKSVINIGNRPLFSYVLETFCKHKLIDKVILVINPQKQKLFKLGILSKNTKISICQGDNASRQNSLVNGFKHLGKIVKLKNNDIIITHDVARPFISPKIINDHIKNTKCYGYSTTLYQINDSMCEIIKNKINYLNRENKYIVQTPQSLLFKNWKIKESSDSSTDLFTYLNASLNISNIVWGGWRNIKLTTKSDFKDLNSFKVNT